MEENKTPPQNEVKEISPPIPIPEKPKLSRLKILVLGVCAGLVLVSFAGAYFLGRNSSDDGNSPSPSEKACTLEAKVCPDGSSVGRSGPNCEFAPCPEPTSSSSSTLDKTYTSAEHNWQIDYPSDLKVETRSDSISTNGFGSSVNFSKLGPTQKEATEFYDGITMRIGVVKKDPSDSIKTAADKETTQADPDISTKTPLKEITINGLSGYETKISGLGTFRVIMLEDPNQSDRAYYISIFADGPGSSKAEYEKIVSDMLAGFRNTD